MLEGGLRYLVVVSDVSKDLYSLACVLEAFAALSVVKVVLSVPVATIWEVAESGRAGGRAELRALKKGASTRRMQRPPELVPIP